MGAVLDARGGGVVTPEELDELERLVKCACSSCSIKVEKHLPALIAKVRAAEVLAKEAERFVGDCHKWDLSIEEHQGGICECLDAYRKAGAQ